ncbi:MAG: hypothetical protein LBN05_03625 [Oscillospiraceae bacterium]|jgi:hypothetical protein|nr:hypothetical protein [Oscillospiraceae bacterium]
MSHLLFLLWNFTWALPQNLAGLVLYLKNRKCAHKRFGHAIISYLPLDIHKFGGVSLGMFIFINPGRPADWVHDADIHEYGHTMQSLLLGPLYLIVIGIASFVWCNLPACRKIWKRPTGDGLYYTLFTEGWANDWGCRATKTDFIDDQTLQYGLYGKPYPPRFDRKGETDVS